MLEGLNSTKEIAKQLQNSTGEAYDAVSGAKETAKGHVSAVENALERSRKFKKEGKKSDIDYIEFVKRPDGVAKGKTLDLTHTVLRLHMSGETKDISFDEFVNYGIVADPANGTELPKEVRDYTKTFGKGELGKLIAELYKKFGFEKTSLHRKQTRNLLFLRVRVNSPGATHVLQAAKNNFPNAILFDYNLTL